MTDAKTTAGKPAGAKKAPAKPPATKKTAADKGHQVISPLRHDGRNYAVGARVVLSASSAKRLRALGAIK